MNGLSKIGLGTAQWGMNYGIKNVDGKPQLSEVKKILHNAQLHSIGLLDTAFAYGESEQILGLLAQQTDTFRIVTKTYPIQKNRISHSDVEIVLASFYNSLNKLKREKTYGLLIHHTRDILAEGGDRLWNSLQELKGLSLLEKLGVSVYDPGELEEVLSRYDIDIVQLPINIYDQRFLKNEILKACKNMSIEIHSRSCFLQGVLLIDPDRLPERFEAVKKLQEQLYHEIHNLGLTPLQACLNFSLLQPYVDQTIVGCETFSQYEEIVAASEILEFDYAFLEKFHVDDRLVINPSLWQS